MFWVALHKVFLFALLLERFRGPAGRMDCSVSIKMLWNKEGPF